MARCPRPLFLTLDGGQTWSFVASPTLATLRALSLASATAGWFVGDAGTILRTHPQ
jgi:photosystem II stability/assembly factor-like uncharacterized protein